MNKTKNSVRVKDLAQARVLVIDQDTELLSFAKWALTNTKVAAVRTLTSGADVRAVLAEFRPDVAIIELNMAGIGGVEFIRRVRGNDMGVPPDLPIVLMTKSADAAQILAACQAGLNNIIAKPFTADILLKRLRTTLSYPDRHIEFTPPPEAPRAPPAPKQEAEPKPAPKAAQPRAAVKPPEPRIAKPREKVEVAPPTKSAPRPAVAPVQTRQAAPIRPRAEEDDVPLTDAPPARPPREDIPLVDEPPTPPIEDVKDDVPLVDAPIETPEEAADEIAAEIAEIISGHSVWVDSGGKQGQRASFNGADLAGRDFSGRNLASASFRDADLQDTDFEGAILHSADLRGANLSSARLSNADLGQARLRRAVLKAANLSGANLKDADFAGADCANADFTGADITRANFLGANLAGADLRGEQLTQSQLTKAIADATTKLPGGLRLPRSDEN